MGAKRTSRPYGVVTGIITLFLNFFGMRKVRVWLYEEFSCNRISASNFVARWLSGKSNAVIRDRRFLRSL